VIQEVELILVDVLEMLDLDVPVVLEELDSVVLDVIATIPDTGALDVIATILDTGALDVMTTELDTGALDVVMEPDLDALVKRVFLDTVVHVTVLTQNLDVLDQLDVLEELGMDVFQETLVQQAVLTARHHVQILHVVLVLKIAFQTLHRVQPPLLVEMYFIYMTGV